MDARTYARQFAVVVSLAFGWFSATAAFSEEEAAAPASIEAAGKTGVAGGLNPDMSLDDLVRQDVIVPGLSTVVTTVDRQERTVGRSPAAIFVITQEMIKRSGVRNIPEALRMVPGIDVARIDASTWAISARGFNNRFANKLLVQIDGRVVYNATFGGVYWNMQDVVLPDVERIEVIRGPGTTAWGSNAVNGVINVITKKSSDTQGALVQSGGGDQERDFNTVRYGGKNAEGLTWRVFGQQFDRNRGWSDSGIDDSWRQQHGGFRVDYAPTEEDTFTVQGDIFNGYAGERLNYAIPTPPFNTTINDETHFPGGNLLLRYNRVIDSETSWQVLSYYDRYQYNTATFAQTRNTYNVDVQYQFSPAEYHQFIAGGFYRISQDFTTGSFSVSLVPPAYATQWASVFAQDTMTLIEDRWYFTLGARLEQNTFGGFQVEPTARLLYLPSERESLWCAVSRAVRNPTRVDADIVSNTNLVSGLPLFLNLSGDPHIEPENLIAYEVGYRAAPTDDFSWDVATFINDYHKLEGIGPTGPPVVDPSGLIFLPAMFANNLRALSYGAEVTMTYQLSDTWRLFGAYTWLELQARGGDPVTAAMMNGSSPHNQIYLRSSWDLGSDVQIDLIGRYVDRLSALDVPRYIEMDCRIGWQIGKNLEFSVVGQNLLNNHHLEFVDFLEGGLASTQVRRGVFAMMSWTH